MKKELASIGRDDIRSKGGKSVLVPLSVLSRATGGAKRFRQEKTFGFFLFRAVLGGVRIAQKRMRLRFLENKQNITVLSVVALGMSNKKAEEFLFGLHSNTSIATRA